MKNEYEKLYPGDKVVYKSKYYLVSTGHYSDNDGMQVVRLIRVADIESNRSRKPSKLVRAEYCKIINESMDRETQEIRRKNK